MQPPGPARPTARAYKDVTYQQLRSFCETARLGSLAAAADSLGLSHPTVWKQVHALEREFGAALVEPFGRGCRLTDAGRLLAELAAPSIACIGQLKRTLREALALAETTVTVATTPRVLLEELPDCVLAFEAAWPKVRLHFREMRDDQVAAEVEAGRVDLGLAPDAGQAADHPRLGFESCAELDVTLVTPRDHPLARKRAVRPDDLKPYPLVTSPEAFGESEIRATLKRHGLFAGPPARVAAFHAQTIRRYVALGFGIGLVSKLPGRPPGVGLHERPMSRYFGRHQFFFIWRKGVPASPAARAFADTVKSILAGTPPPTPGPAAPPVPGGTGRRGGR